MTEQEAKAKLAEIREWAKTQSLPVGSHDWLLGYRAAAKEVIRKLKTTKKQKFYVNVYEDGLGTQIYYDKRNAEKYGNRITTLEFEAEWKE